eukprot:12647496-Alexandrium_andersonii.AAC.1
MRLLSQPVPGERVADRAGSVGAESACGPPAPRAPVAGVAATRRKGRGKGRKGCPDCGGHGREGGAEPHGREGGAEKKLCSLADLPQNWWTPVPQDR